MGIAASKSSVALFLLRIVLLKWHKAILWFCIVSTTLMCTITTTLLFLQCRPAAFLWDHTIEGGVCWLDFTSVGLTMGGKRATVEVERNAVANPATAWSAAMDFVLAILPWHVVLGLNMKRKEKLTVAFGLSLGILYVFLSRTPHSPHPDLSQRRHLLHNPHLRAPNPLLRQ